MRFAHTFLYYHANVYIALIAIICTKNPFHSLDKARCTVLDYEMSDNLYLVLIIISVLIAVPHFCSKGYTFQP